MFCVRHFRSVIACSDIVCDDFAFIIVVIKNFQMVSYEADGSINKSAVPFCSDKSRVKS